jgi:hypothetical protein
VGRPPEARARALGTRGVLMGGLTLAGCGALDEPEKAEEHLPLRAEHPLDGGGSAMDASSLYPQVVDIIARSCSYERCHAGPLVGAGLSFEPGTDVRAALVGVRACQYDRMARVEPGDPDRSWLMIKLTEPFRPIDDPYAHAIYFAPPPGWDPLRRGCRDQTREGVPLFGQRMPATAPNSLPPAELDLLRRWIASGAPP